jgi:hypothetical protein
MTEPTPSSPEPRRHARPAIRDPMDSLIRRERKVRRLPPNAACAFCGETNPLVLEVHHIAGVANEAEATVVLCLNHHRTQSADQKAVGVDLDAGRERTVLDRVVAWLRGLGLFFTGLAKSCWEMADRLAAFSVGLDANYPGWRTMPEADG